MILEEPIAVEEKWARVSVPDRKEVQSLNNLAQHLAVKIGEYFYSLSFTIKYISDRRIFVTNIFIKITSLGYVHHHLSPGNKFAYIYPRACNREKSYGA